MRVMCDAWQDQDSARRIRASPGVAAGLRNRIVHEYDEIAARKLHETLQVAVKQIPVYLDAIKRSLLAE